MWSSVNDQAEKMSYIILLLSKEFSKEHTKRTCLMSLKYNGDKYF